MINDVLEDPDEQPDAGVHRLRSRRVLSTGALSPWNWGATLPALWMCSMPWNPLVPEFSQSLICSPPSCPKGQWVGLKLPTLQSLGLSGHHCILRSLSSSTLSHLINTNSDVSQRLLVSNRRHPCHSGHSKGLQVLCQVPGTKTKFISDFPTTMLGSGVNKVIVLACKKQTSVEEADL